MCGCVVARVRVCACVRGVVHVCVGGEPRASRVGLCGVGGRENRVRACVCSQHARCLLVLAGACWCWCCSSQNQCLNQMPEPMPATSLPALQCHDSFRPSPLPHPPPLPHPRAFGFFCKRLLANAPPPPSRLPPSRCTHALLNAATALHGADVRSRRCPRQSPLGLHSPALKEWDPCRGARSGSCMLRSWRKRAFAAKSEPLCEGRAPRRTTTDELQRVTLALLTRALGRADQGGIPCLFARDSH